jgi:hypothetical protein
VECHTCGSEASKLGAFAAFEVRRPPRELGSSVRYAHDDRDTVADPAVAKALRLKAQRDPIKRQLFALHAELGRANQRGEELSPLLAEISRVRDQLKALGVDGGSTPDDEKPWIRHRNFQLWLDRRKGKRFAPLRARRPLRRGAARRVRRVGVRSRARAPSSREPDEPEPPLGRLARALARLLGGQQ